MRLTLTGKSANCVPGISKIYYKMYREHQNYATEILVAQYKLSRLAPDLSIIVSYQSGKFVLCDRDLGRAVLMFPIYFIVNF